MVAAFAAVSAMVFALKEQQLQIVKALQTLSMSMQPCHPCPSGFGWFSNSGIWRPFQYNVHDWLQVGTDVSDYGSEQVSGHLVSPNGPGSTQGIFVIGAQSHEVSGIRRLTRLDHDSVDIHARDFLGMVTVAGNQVLSAVVDAFQIRGAPTLRTVLIIKKVRRFLPQNL